MANQIPRFAPDVITPLELAEFRRRAEADGPTWDLIVAQTCTSLTWGEETQRLIDRANAGFEDAVKVIAMVLTAKLTR